MRKFLPIAFAAALLFGGAGCSLAPQVQIKPVTLEYWRTQDDQDTMADQIAAYKKLHPNVDIVYRKMREEDYEKLLLEAFAENRGPDIFSIPNVWLGGWKNKILPIPKEIVIPTQEVNAQKKIVTVKKKTPGLSILDFRNRFVEGVTKELVQPVFEKEGKPPTDMIMGLPLSADTLAMYYNKDILKKGQIEKPPATWRDVQDLAARLTILEAPDPAHPGEQVTAIKQSGAAIGGSKNIQYATDLLASLMTLNGAQMAEDSYGYATFSHFTQESEDAGKQYPPGVEALMFYQSFTIPGSQGYSWNADMPNSLDAFITGRTALYFGLPYDMQKIRERAPKLDFGIAPLPLIDATRPGGILHYPVEVVAKKTAHPDEAWDFLEFLTAEDQAGPFLTASKRPTALRSLINAQLTDVDIAPFAGQVLNARAWYRGNDYAKVEDAFNYMIDWRPTIERPDYITTVAEGENKVNETLR
ncbi:MAG TPA: extracellular solute-binding protein [Candidatus Binatia bacterium]|nr:extracellular solute-binding protein [Candidatus Binatia bacterium]